MTKAEPQTINDEELVHVSHHIFRIIHSLYLAATCCGRADLVRGRMAAASSMAARAAI
jgi:hypothetical protein